MINCQFYQTFVNFIYHSLNHVLKSQIVKCFFFLFIQNAHVKIMCFLKMQKTFSNSEMLKIIFNVLNVRIHCFIISHTQYPLLLYLATVFNVNIFMLITIKIIFLSGSFFFVATATLFLDKSFIYCKKIERVFNTIFSTSIFAQKIPKYFINLLHIF